MFTVKHRDGFGTENIYSADSVRIVRRGDRFEDGIYLNYRPTDEGHTTDVIITFVDPTALTTEQPFPSTERPVVWIVNEAGETVATHYLT